VGDPPTAKMSEEVNRKWHPRNTTVQTSTPYTDPECHNTHPHRQGWKKVGFLEKVFRF